MFRDFIHNLIENPAQAYPQAVRYALIGAGVALAFHLALSLLRPSNDGPRPRWSWWEKLVYLLTLATVAVLGGTAFYSVFAHGAMHGWSLLLHVAAAGGFVAALFLIAFTWPQANRFFKDPATRRAEKKAAEQGLHAPPARFYWLTKLTFWIILVSGVVTALTMLLSMLPLLGTEQMLEAINIHRYAGLVLVVAMLLHLYGVLIGKVGLR